MKVLKKILKLATFLFLIVFLLFSLGFLRLRGENYQLGNGVSYLIEKDIGIGDDLSKVSKWLDSKGIHRRSFAKGSYEMGLDSRIASSKYISGGANSVVIALIPNVEYSLTTVWNTTIFLFFDRSGKFIGFTSQKMGIGL